MRADGVERNRGAALPARLELRAWWGSAVGEIGDAPADHDIRWLFDIAERDEPPGVCLAVVLPGINAIAWHGVTSRVRSAPRRRRTASSVQCERVRRSSRSSKCR